MYLVPIAWLYVVLMMAVAEAFSTNGSVLGAIITFVLYGVLPIALVVYLMGTPARRRARLARELAPMPAPPASGDAPDAGGHAPAAAAGDVVAPVREKD